MCRMVCSKNLVPCYSSVETFAWPTPIFRVLKNGGVVIFENGTQHKDYNGLQTTFNVDGKSPKIHTFDGSNSSIMAIGFDHFKGCKIERVILDRCTHMENEALEKLGIIKDTLKDLRVTNCLNVEDSGLLTINQLSNLQKLTIYGFRYVKDFDGVIRQLQQSLPKCIIHSKPPE